MKQQLYCNCLAAALKSHESACSKTPGWSADPTKRRRNVGTCFSGVRILPWEELFEPQCLGCSSGSVFLPNFFYYSKRSNLQLTGDTGLSHWQFPVWQIRVRSEQTNSSRKHCQSLLSPKTYKQKAKGREVLTPPLHCLLSYSITPETRDLKTPSLWIPNCFNTFSKAFSCSAALLGHGECRSPCASAAEGGQQPSVPA